MKVWLVGRPERYWDTSAIYFTEKEARKHADFTREEVFPGEVLWDFHPADHGLCPSCHWEIQRGHAEGCPAVDWEAVAVAHERRTRRHRKKLVRLTADALRGDTPAREALSRYARDGDAEARRILAEHNLEVP